MDLSDVVAGGINAGQDALNKSGKKDEKKGGCMRFFVTLIWFVVSFGVAAGGIVAMTGAAVMGMEPKQFLLIGIISSGLVALITFLVPYLRKPGTMTRWFGILALGDFVWYLYLLISE